jgi:1-acyl-sn-glycerol-3-phosphate acyltransferase
MQIIGAENLPKDGSFILVANHCSHLDAPCLLSALPLTKLHRTFPCAAADYFFVSLPRVALAAICINAMPFARQVHIRQSLNLCRGLLGNAGNVLIIFPEGTRTTTGELGQFRPGIGSLLAGLDIPVVPCALQGTFGALSKGMMIPRPRAVRLVIGTPRTYVNVGRDRQAVHGIASELHQAVRELLCK